MRNCKIQNIINKDGFLLKIDGLAESYDSSLKQAKGSILSVNNAFI